MVGIVLASHGGLVDEIFQSAEMIFGKQESLAHVILEPDEGPDDIKAKMEKAVTSFDDQDQILLLIDLWGGMPFNQANNLVKEHEDTWAIVSGMNLPMVVEALGQRVGSDNAHDIAKAIVKPGRDGIKTQPGSLMPRETTEKSASNPDTQPQGTIPEGAVISDDHIKCILARIDSHLLHDRVAASWTRAINPNRIIVISDNVAKNEIHKTMIKEATPAGVPTSIVPIDKVPRVVRDPRFGNTKTLILFKNPEDALKAIEGGVDIKESNIGSMTYSDDKVNANTVLATDQKDIDTYKKLKDLDVKFDARKIPSDGKRNMGELLEKVQKSVDEKK